MANLENILGDVSVVLTSAGEGRRNRPISLSSPTSMIPKGLMRVKGIPLSELQILDLKGAGLSEFYIITRFLENREQLSNRFGDGSLRFGVRISYSDPLEDILNNGSGDSILRNLTNRQLDGHSIVLANDNLYGANWKEAVKFHKDKNAVITILATLTDPRDTIKTYGLLSLDERGRVTKITEKPESEAEVKKNLGLADSVRLEETSACINTAGYILNNSALKELTGQEWVREGRKKEAGEFDMAGNLIKGGIERGIPVYAIVIDKWADLGSNIKYLASVERALEGGFPFIDKVLRAQGYITLEGNVWIHNETYNIGYNGSTPLKDLIGSKEVEIGPNVFIGRGVQIKKGARIRYSSIEKSVNIGEKSDISHSVIFPYCIIGEGATIERSILGLQVHIDSSESQPTEIRTNSFLGPEIFVPRGYSLLGVTVFPAYQFGPNPEVIINQILKPDEQSIKKAVKFYMR